MNECIMSSRSVHSERGHLAIEMGTTQFKPILQSLVLIRNLKLSMKGPRNTIPALQIIPAVLQIHLAPSISGNLIIDTRRPTLNQKPGSWMEMSWLKIQVCRQNIITKRLALWIEVIRLTGTWVTGMLSTSFSTLELARWTEKSRIKMGKVHNICLCAGRSLIEFYWRQIKLSQESDK